ncbi:hypothetical protein D3C80_1764140 [compost metagenome]
MSQTVNDDHRDISRVFLQSFCQSTVKFATLLIFHLLGICECRAAGVGDPNDRAPVLGCRGKSRCSGFCMTVTHDNGCQLSGAILA